MFERFCNLFGVFDTMGRILCVAFDDILVVWFAWCICGLWVAFVGYGFGWIVGANSGGVRRMRVLVP